MKILKRILLVLAILLFVVTAIGLLLPSRVYVERSVNINKPQEMVFNYVNTINNWNKWSPWFELDTTASYTQEGPSSGQGAKLIWISENKDVGKGSMTFVEVEAPNKIKQALNFMEEGVATGTYSLETAESGTKFTWSLEFDTGFNPLLRIMGKFMDGMVGKDFEKGLNKLKSILESMPEPQLEVPVIVQDSIPS
ncbi:MAG: SRPBCC family protein [Bacteroidia bacterium]|nr:SRPBCC family protein [Bacteroidia bacterium]